METFIHHHQGKITGVLNGFDRLLFQGVLRTLSSVAGMANYLHLVGTLLKEFGEFAWHNKAWWILPMVILLLLLALLIATGTSVAPFIYTLF